MRLIDADALPEHKFPENQCNKFGDGAYYRQGWNDAIDAIVDNEPIVDAVPVRRGRWVYHPEIGWGSTYLCSECGEKAVETIMGEPRYKFCPMCGADMRKDGEHDRG